MQVGVNMGTEKIIKEWIKSADEDFDAVMVLFNGKKYVQSLFFGHLTLEKLLKALYAKVNPEQPHAPKSHDLLFLAKKCHLEPCAEISKFGIINTFNMACRYEDEKREFYKLCTSDYAKQHIKHIEEARKWLKEKLTKR